MLGGRRHCNGRQEPFLERQLVLRRAAGAAAEPLWRGVRRRFTVRQEPRRVDVQQETRLWVTAGGPRWGRSQGVAHEEASCWCSSLWCVWRVAAHQDVVCSCCKRGGVGRGTHTSEEGVVVRLSAGARESHQVGLSMAVAVDKEELRTGERGVEPCPIRYRVSVRRQEGEYGPSVDGGFGLGVPRRRVCEWSMGPPLMSGAFSLQQLAEPHTTSGPWEMEMWTAITIQKLGVE